MNPNSVLSMQPLFAQFSGLVGLLAFLNALWRNAPLEQTLITGIGAGIVIFFVLACGDVAVRRILESTPPRLAERASARGVAGSHPEAGTDKLEGAEKRSA
jgi:hypothetical protein